MGISRKVRTSQGAHGGFWAGLIIAGLLGVACVPAKVNVKSAPEFDPTMIQSMAILPFQALATPQRTAVGGSQYPEAPSEVRTQFILPGEQGLLGSETTTDPVKVSDVAAQRITSMVYSKLSGRRGVRILPRYQVAQAFSDQTSREPSLNWRDQVKQLGTTLQADAVLIGLVRVYREREGTKIAATPAVVGFESHLIDSVTGKVLWTGSFYEEQKPLNQDLMGFLEKKGVFVTAEELAQSGVDKMMEKFPVGL